MANKGPERFGYREMACLCAQWARQGWTLGLRSGDAVVCLSDCPVHSPRVNYAAALFSRILPPDIRFPLKYYVQSGAQIVLVLASSKMPETAWLGKDVKAHLEQAGIEGLWLHLFASAGKRVFAKNKWHLIWGKPRSMDEEGFLYGPTAFQQLIPKLHKHALERAGQFLRPAPGDRIVDLYCGTGQTLAGWTACGTAACGVEISAEAVECARKNAVEATVFQGLCTHRIPQLNQWVSPARPHKRLVYVNPPRTGLEHEISKWIGRHCRPRKMAYLSCSAGTLQRDLKYLEETGLKVTSVYPYDFFPNTRHVETCVLLERKV